MFQGTLPQSLKEPTYKIMWKGVKISNAIIAMCLFPLAIGGYWTYGTLVSMEYIKQNKTQVSALMLNKILIYLIISDARWRDVEYIIWEPQLKVEASHNILIPNHKQLVFISNLRNASF